MKGGNKVLVLKRLNFVHKATTVNTSKYEMDIYWCN